MASPLPADVRAQLSRAYQVRAERVEEARRSPWFFNRYVLRDEITQGPIRLAPCHREWHDFIDAHDRMVLFAAVSMGKSSQLVGRIIWEVGRDTTIRILLLSNTHNQAVKIVRAVGRYIKTSPEVRAVYPNLRPMWPWTDSFITVDRPVISRDATVSASGVHGNILGSRYDLIVIDDILDEENTRTEEQRKKLIQWVEATVMGRLTARGRVIVCGTAWHPCLLPDQRVMTNRGVRRADQLAPEDEMLVGPAKWERPLAAESRLVDTAAVEIKAAGLHRPLRLTHNHRVPTSRGLLEAGEVVVGDRLIMDRAPLVPGIERAHEPASEMRARAGKVTGRRTKIDRDTLVEELASGRTYGEIAKRYGYTSGRKTIHYLVNVFGIEPRHQENRATAGFTSTAAWWTVAGYWLAEGTADPVNNRVCFSFGRSDDPEEMGFAEECAEAIRASTGLTPHVTHEAGKIRVWFCCEQAVAWLHRNLGRGARRKQLAPWVEQVTPDLARPFLLAYWKGDGCLTSAGTRFNTSSEALVCGLQRWIANLGHPSCTFMGVSKPGLGPGGVETFELRLAREEARALGLPHLPIAKRQPTHATVFPDRIEIPVRRVEHFRHQGWIYDLQTSTGWFGASNVRIHNSDLLHHLTRVKGWPRREYPAARGPVGAEETGVLTWPERWSAAAITRARRDLGPFEFARQILCRSRDDSQARFRREWVERCKARGEGKRLGYALAKVPRGYMTYTGVDLGVQQHAGSDPTVLFTIIVHPDETREVLMVESGRWTAPQIVEKIIDTHRRYDSIVLVEDNAAQAFIYQLVRKVSAVPVRPFTTTAAKKHHPEYGIESLATELANGKWIIPCVGGVCEPEIEGWIQEMLNYNPEAHSGDRLMSSWFAREGAVEGRRKAKGMVIDTLTR